MKQCMRQVRNRTGYATYEEQLKFGTSVVKKPDFTKSFEKRAFTGNQDGTNIRRRSFYETKSVSQAVQFMQAGHSMPPPEEEKEKLTYSKYMSEAMSRDIDGRRSNERSGNIEDPLQDRRSFEEREAEAKKAASEAKKMGQELLDSTGRLKEFAEDNIKKRSNEPPLAPKSESLPFLTNEYLDDVVARADATPMPLYESSKGRNDKERLLNHDQAMRAWEEREKLGSNLMVDLQRRTAEKGAPQMHNWTKGQEAVYRTAKTAFIEEQLKKPGWKASNIGVMLAKENHGKQVGLVNMTDLRPPEWQL